jgi:hypothetical protein
VFVVGAYIPNGGTYMAYHLGRLLQRDFDIEAISVTVGNEQVDNGVHRYDLRMPAISIHDLIGTITDSDILIANPSFSKYLFGWKLPGFKISYVQGFSTYEILDLRFDCYVAVSDFVQQFLRAVYAIEAPVIPAFINLQEMPAAADWGDRPELVVLPYRKGIGEIWDISFRRLKQLTQQRMPALGFEEPLFGDRWMPQSQLFRALGRYRYLLVLSVAEGLPLVPLEAMAMSVVVAGYDGFGGRHYMRPGVNCAVAPYPEIEQAAELLIAAMKSPEASAAMSRSARETAGQYSYEMFRQRWLGEFSRVLEIPRRSGEVRA